MTRRPPQRYPELGLRSRTGGLDDLHLPARTGRRDTRRPAGAQGRHAELERWRHDPAGAERMLRVIEVRPATATTGRPGAAEGRNGRFCDACESRETSRSPLFRSREAGRGVPHAAPKSWMGGAAPARRSASRNERKADHCPRIGPAARDLRPGALLRWTRAGQVPAVKASERRRPVCARADRCLARGAVDSG